MELSTHQSCPIEKMWNNHLKWQCYHRISQMKIRRAKDVKTQGNQKNLTASKTEVHREDDRRRWLGPPSFPLMGPGRVKSLANTSEWKMEVDNLVNETSSSCQLHRNKLYWAVKLEKRYNIKCPIHTRNDNSTTEIVSNIIDSWSWYFSIPPANWYFDLLSRTTWNSLTKQQTRIRNFTTTHSKLFSLQISAPWFWMNCTKRVQIGQF